MRRRTLTMITTVLILTLIASAMAVMPGTGQDTGTIVTKLNDLNTRLQGEKPALQNKVNAVIHQIEAGALNGAVNKLENDVKKSITAWVENPGDLLQLVDEIIDLIKGIIPPPPPTPDFGLSIPPNRLDVVQGGSNTTIIQVTSKNNFSQQVTLNATSTASDVSISSSPDSVTPPINGSVSSILSIEAALGALPGDYEINVTGTSGTLEHWVIIPLKIIEAVTPPPIKDFELTASPTTLVVQQGKSNTSVISVASINGFSKQVDLATTSTPITGVNLTLNPTEVLPLPDSYALSILIVDVESSTAPGTHTVTVTGESNLLEHAVNITLTIVEPSVQPKPDFAINTFPTQLTIEQGDTASSTVILTSLRGFCGAVTLTIAPDSITNIALSLDPVQVTLTPNAVATSTLRIDVDILAEPSDHEVTITGTSGSIQHGVSLSFKIILEKKPPRIVSILRLPPHTPTYNETATLFASVVDLESGVQNVILSYSHNGIQQNLTMTLENGLYEATIPAFVFNTLIQYRVYASDIAGNWATSTTYSYITSDPYPPTISLPTWQPQEPVGDETVTVNVTASEPPESSGVSMVVLWYKNNTASDWNHVLMTPTSMTSGNWSGTIANQTGATIEFYVEAIDHADNRIQSPTQEYNVTVPAFPLAWILAAIVVLASATGGGAYYARRKRRKGATATSVPSAAVEPTRPSG